MPRKSASDRRADFVAAAVVVIAEHGVDGATTRRIAEQANAPLASLHYVFHTKEDLFGAVCRELSRVLCDEVLVLDGGEGDLAEASSALLRRLMTWYSQESEFSVAALELILWARRQHGDLAVRIYEDSYAASRAVLRRLADDSPASESFIDRIPTMVAAIADGHVLSWLTNDDRSVVSDEISTAVEVLRTWVAQQLARERTGAPLPSGSG